jgi:hypothetical protein
MRHEYVDPTREPTTSDHLLQGLAAVTTSRATVEARLRTPGRSMQAMQLQINFRDVIWIGHVVVDCRAAHSVCAAAVLLPPTNSGVDRYICDVDAERH